jgi:hypothetical protein
MREEKVNNLWDCFWYTVEWLSAAQEAAVFARVLVQPISYDFTSPAHLERK